MEGWDALDPSAIQAIRHAEARDGASTSTASASMAPSVPDSVVEKGKKRTLNLQQKLQATIADPTMNPATALIDDAEEWKKSMADLESPLTSKARERTLANWAGFIGLVKPDLSTNDYWLRDIVKEQAVNFLYSLVKTTDPLPNKQSIKARTLTWWTGLFLYSIVTYTRDNRWKKCGITLLVTDGLYHEIKKAVIHLVHTFKLDRYADKRIYFNRFELGMIIDACLQASLHVGRQVAVQHIVSYLITFYFTSRASSLGPTHQKWLQLEYQPILEDLTILCLGPLQWEIIFRLRHFKTAITSAEGQEQTFHITGALRAHNALFDLTVVFMAHLWMLNAFKTKYATPQDLFNDTSAKLDLDPAMLHEPIFRKASQGGREFEHPPQAAMSRSFYDSFRYWAHQAGLPRAGVGALRRDTGNTYALQMGQKMAKDILNHHVLGVFRRSYSRNMENLRLVGVRLGEVSGTKETVPGEKLKENLERNMFTSYAVEALVRHRNVDPEESQDAVSERKAFKECLKNKELKVHEQARQSSWAKYLLCFSATAAGYVLSKPNANKIFNRATGTIKLKDEDTNPLTFKSPWNSTTTDPIRQEFLKAEANFLKEQTKLLRRYDEQQKNKKNWDILASPLSGTAQERRALVDELMKEHPSNHVHQAAQDAIGRLARPANPEDVDSFRKWASNLAQASATAAIADYADDPDVHDDAGGHDRLIKYLDRLSVSDTAPELALPVAAAATEAEGQNLEIEDGPDVDESVEADVLDIPVTDMRKAMFEYLVLPVVTARAYAKLLNADGKYVCPRCTLYTHRDPVPEASFDTISKLERHLLSNHSEWADLELQMIEEDGTFKCPAGDFTDVASVEEVRAHAVSNCVQAAAFRQLQQVAADAIPKKDETRSYRQKRAGRSNVANGINEFDEDEDDNNNDNDPEEHKDLKTQIKDLVAAAVERSTSAGEEADVLTGVLFDYIDEVGGDLQQTSKPKTGKGAGVDWNSLQLDSWA